MASGSIPNYLILFLILFLAILIDVLETLEDKTEESVEAFLHIEDEVFIPLQYAATTFLAADGSFPDFLLMLQTPLPLVLRTSYFP
jgi:hypothetical protein